MCILSYLAPGVPVETEDLLNGGLLNADGSGWAIAVVDDWHPRIVMGKALQVEEALDGFCEARKRYPDAPALFHSRWATHGQVNLSNTHPFLVGGSHKTVMAHNGILPCTPGKDDPRSDTRLFADDILSTRYRRLDRERAFKAMEWYVGSFNKIVILTVDPRYRENVYIVNEKKGHVDSSTGIWHSNFDYLGYPTKYVPAGKHYGTNSTGAAKKAAQTFMPGMCVICQYGTIGRGGYCVECGTCEDCLEAKMDCMCFARYAFSAGEDWGNERYAPLPDRPLALPAPPTLTVVGNPPVDQ